jgi:Flp pilus assembly protein TadD
MIRRLSLCLVLWIAGMGFAGSPLLSQQQPGPVSPAAEGSPSTSTATTKEQPPQLTPLQEAKELYSAGKFDKAADRYYAIIATDPTADKAVAFTGLARAYLKLGKPDDAYVAATKALEQNPSFAAAHTVLGEVYFHQGKPEQAQAEFLAALKLDPSDARANLGLSRFYQSTYDFKQAKIAIDKAYSIASTDPDIADAWVETRPRAEQAKSLEERIAAHSGYYSRAERAGFRQRLTLIQDEIEHPERTCQMAAPPEGADLRLNSIGPKKEFTGLQAHVNGVSARLVLSTVSSGIVINRKIAEGAKVLPIARADLDALGEQNPPEVYIGFAPSLKIENLEFENCYVTVIEQAAPKSFYDQFDGSIAAGFFSTYTVDLDMVNGMMSLRPLPSRPDAEQNNGPADTSDPDARNFHDRYVAPVMAAWTRMYRFGSAILIPAQVNNSPAALFEVSTSTEFNILSPAFAQKWASLGTGKRTQSAGLEGINGRVSTPLMGKAKLAFADLHFDKVRVMSFDDARSSESAGTQISGFLGHELLRSLHVAIDYRDGLILFENGQTLP